MTNPLLRTLISEMIENYLEEGSRSDYDYTIAHGIPPKPKTQKVSKPPLKSYDELHKEVSSIRKVEHKPNGNFELHHSTSSSKPISILKKSGWEHHSGSHKKYGYNSSVTYKHPDGHKITYHHDSHKLTLKKGEE